MMTKRTPPPSEELEAEVRQMIILAEREMGEGRNSPEEIAQAKAASLLTAKMHMLLLEADLPSGHTLIAIAELLTGELVTRTINMPEKQSWDYLDGFFSQLKEYTMRRYPITKAKAEDSVINRRNTQ